MNQTQLPISFLENVYDLTTIETNWFGLKKKNKTNVCLKAGSNKFMKSTIITIIKMLIKFH